MDPMTISMIISLLVYLLSPKDTPAERRRAVMGAAVAGLGTYYVTTQTDWGKSLIGAGTTKPAANPVTIGGAGQQPAGNGTVGAQPTVVTPTVPLSETLTSYAPLAAVAAGGAVLGSSTFTKYLPAALMVVGGLLAMRWLSPQNRTQG